MSFSYVFILCSAPFTFRSHVASSLYSLLHLFIDLKISFDCLVGRTQLLQEILLLTVSAMIFLGAKTSFL